MDPQQRLLLEVAWEAFEDAGYRPGAAARPVGVFVGSGGVVSSYLVDRLAFSAELPGHTGSLAHIGNDKDFLSTRISYKLNLTGPSINVQTACSTSLVAVHLACQAILAGECDMALAGAATVRVPQRVGYVSRKGDILSPDGHCRAFDAEAQGTIFGSGAGAILLKDLDAAIADRDNIYAVIRGSAINNDGAEKVSYTASNVAGQTRAMLEAMLVADVYPGRHRLCRMPRHRHDRRRSAGDRCADPRIPDAEPSGRGFCAIGSVKTNLGHLEQTAGIAGLIKVALALKNGRIPASLNFRTPNPKIDFAASPFFVNTECLDWPTDRPRLAAVNSLGLGGTNAFAVLEQAPRRRARRRRNEPPLHLFLLSAKTPCRAARIDRASPCLARGPIRRRSCRHLLHAEQWAKPFRASFCDVAARIAQLRAALAESCKGALRTIGCRRADRGGSPSCSPGKARSTPAWLRNSTVISRYSGSGRPLRRAAARSAGTAAVGCAFRTKRRHRCDPRNRVHPACLVRRAGRLDRAVAVVGHRSRRRAGPQRRGIRRRLLCGSPYTRGWAVADHRARATDAVPASRWSDGGHFRG